MGCWNTKHSYHDRHIFKVMNIDEHGHLICPGHLELTDTEMVLYQKGKSTKWPLAYIRRYGFESELFSFECGRRCPGGHGIYAFRCRRAELLFNLLQERITIQRREDTPLVFPEPQLSSIGPVIPQRPDGYLEPLPPTTEFNNNYSNTSPESSESIEDLHQYMNIATDDLNYAVLDLDAPVQAVDESPEKKQGKGYTMIDFNKTEAVSAIAKPKQDDGLRKTRHNSTISELSGGGHVPSCSLSD